MKKLKSYMEIMEKAKLAVEIYKITKSIADIRGKDFAKLFGESVKIWAGYFEKQAQDYVDYIENNPQMFLQEIKKISADDEEVFNEEVLNNLIAVYILGQTQQEAEIQSNITIGLAFDIDNQFAMDYAQDRAGELIRGVNETTQKEISSLITSAIENKWSISELAQVINSKFKEYSKYRATLISVMEVGNAYEIGKRTQFDKYASNFGTTGWKRAQTQGDDKVRTTHLQNQADGWIPTNQAFSGTEGDHAPFGFNCRCVTSYSLIDPNPEQD